MRYATEVIFTITNVAGHGCKYAETFEAETLDEIHRFYWDLFTKNKGSWHVYEFIKGVVTDNQTGKKWPVNSKGGYK